MGYLERSPELRYTDFGRFPFERSCFFTVTSYESRGFSITGNQQLVQHKKPTLLALCEGNLHVNTGLSAKMGTVANSLNIIVKWRRGIVWKKTIKWNFLG